MKSSSSQSKSTRKCTFCGGMMHRSSSMTKDGIPYSFYKCTECPEGILDMEQLHEVAERYREMKRHRVKVSKWGGSLGIRIPKELVEHYKFKANDEVALIPEKNGVKILSV